MTTEVRARFPLAALAQDCRRELGDSFSCEIEPYPQGGWLLIASVPEGIWMATNAAYGLVLRAVLLHGGKILDLPG